jgi:hypothetical protein
MKHCLISAILPLLLMTFAGCDRPACKNTNPVFDRYSPQSQEYKAELAKRLETAGTQGLTYWFRDFTGPEGHEELLFNVQGDRLCAVLVLRVEQWDKLAELRKTKGTSYRGAEFKGLEFETLRDTTGNVTFIFRDYKQIID